MWFATADAADGRYRWKMPGASQRLRWHFSTSRGCTRRPQEASGGPRRPQEAPGSCTKPHGAPGSPRRLQEARGSPRRFQEASGSPRRFQEAPGNPRRPQEDPRGGSKMFQETLGSSRGPQALDESASECAPRLSGSATLRKHARGAEAKATFPPFARGVRRVPLLSRIWRRGRQDVHVDKKNVDFALCHR